MAGESTPGEPDVVDTAAKIAKAGLVPGERDEATDLKQEHDSAVRKRDSAKVEYENTRIGLDNLDDTIDEMRAGRASKRDIEKKMRISNELSRIAKRAYETSSMAEKDRKAALWDSSEHYKANKDAYQETARKEAEAAGIDVTFGNSSKPKIEVDDQGSIKVEPPVQPPVQPPTGEV